MKKYTRSPATKKIKIWSYSKRINSINLICEIEMICFGNWVHSRNCVWHFFRREELYRDLVDFIKSDYCLKNLTHGNMSKIYTFISFFVCPGWIQILILPWIILVIYLKSTLYLLEIRTDSRLKVLFCALFKFSQAARDAYYSLNHIIDNRKI